MAPPPIVSLAARRLPTGLTPIELRSILAGKFPEPDYVFHVWPLVKESTLSSTGHATQCGTIAVKVKLGPFQKLQTVIEALCQSLSHRAIHYGGRQWRISIEKDFYGIVPLYEHEQGAAVDIFTIHGLGGHAFHTWCNDARDAPSLVTNWARDFLPADLERANIKACVNSVGYNAKFLHKADKTASIRTLAESLLDELASHQRGVQRPFFFVCHSLGGLILCQALILCLYKDVSYGIEKPQYESVFMRGDELLLKGIQFLGTPFDGSLVADTAKPFVDAISNINPWPTNPGLVEALTHGNPDLSDIVNKFRHIHLEKGVALWIGCEAHPKWGRLVTTRSSAMARFDQTAKVSTINADHTSMVRYDCPDQNYMKIALGLVKMVSEKLSLNDTTHTINVDRNGERLRDPPTNNPTNGPINAQPGSFSASRRAGTMPSMGTHRSQSNSLPANLQSFSDLSVAGGSHTVSNSYNTHTRQSVSGADPVGFDTFAVSANTEAGRALVAKAAPKLEDGSRLAKLNQYDTVFVIDDTSSMILPANQAESEISIGRGERYTDRWNVLERCLEAIVDIAATYDKDGVDVRFLKTGKDAFGGGQTFDLDHITRGQLVLDRLVAIRNMLGTQRCEGGTFFYDTLYSLLSARADEWKKWREQRRSGKTPPFPKLLNVIVVTDGAADDPEMVEWAIKEIAQQLDDNGAPPRCIGVQFLQIGDDEAAATWLKHLDDELGRGEVRFRDMVDTKPWDKDHVEAVLLGAIVPGEDNQRATAQA